MILLIDDTCPRVGSHAFAALTNFLEGCNENMMNIYLKDILEKSAFYLQNGFSLIKENCIATIAHCAFASGKLFS